MAARQTARIAAVSSPLSEDELLLRRLHATEQISRYSTFSLELLSENETIRHEQVLGQRMTVSFALPGGGTRYFDGLVSQFSYLGNDGRYAQYSARVSSWLWFLTRSSNCRVFQHKTVPQIVREVFALYPVALVEDRLTTSYAEREYCVQYRETDYDFVNRLLEHEGIHYFFTHGPGKHTLVLADRDSEPERIEGYAQVPYYPPEDTGRRERDHVSEWTALREARSGGYLLRDFDFEKPRAGLESSRLSPGDYPFGNCQLYDYPGLYTTEAQGESSSRVRIEEVQADESLVAGGGSVAGLIPGCAFALTKHPRADQNRTYRVLGCEFELLTEEYESTGGSGSGVTHRCTFTGIDANHPYRPPRRTPKQTVAGPQTAIVTGPAGEEIHTDKYGRVKVQFHWDREGKRDENSSCWLRVSSPWAGTEWGAIALPRIGQEVIVEFLEGDPDRPIITGRIYNAECMPPLHLPEQKTCSGVKTNSTPGGGGFNALRFRDKKGEEQILLQAERELHLRSGKSAFETVGEARHLIVEKDQREQVKGSKHLSVSGDQNEKIGGTISQQAGIDLQQKVGMKHAVAAGQEIHLKGGMNVVIEAGMSVTLKAGGGFVVVGPTGVTISGTPVLINSGGSAGSGSGCSADAPSPPTEADKWEPGKVDAISRQNKTAAAPVLKSGAAVTVGPRASSAPAPSPSPQAAALRSASETGTPFCEKCG